MLLFTPHPALRATLSLQERDSLQTCFHFGQFWYGIVSAISALAQHDGSGAIPSDLKFMILDLN
jgi:hypothetical protein